VLGLSVVKLALRLTALLALLVLLASCAPSPSDKQPNATSTIDSTVPSSPAATEAASLSKILNFSAPRLGGGQVVGSELAGKDVAMFFWAPW
jgi:hypothetical protein